MLPVWMTCLALVMTSAGCDRDDEPTLRARVLAMGVRAVEPAPRVHMASKVELGRLLFFEKELSGNRDTACATCHHPSMAMGDGRELSIGTGGKGLGASRTTTDREHAPRNSPALFNVNDPAWRAQFWDGRVELFASGEVRTPVAGSLPAGLESVVAVQAMFPVTSRDEMRGERGDLTIDGTPNELADAFDSHTSRIWQGIMVRLLSYEEYRRRFAEVYPGVDAEALGFEHAANALAAFQEEELSLADSPWDRYLRGDDEALSAQAMRGAALFYGEAGCATCHGGALMTDQKFYNLGVPQLGPGKGANKPLDHGRSSVSMNPKDRYKFRTPPLRHVAWTGPYMHNGAYDTLEDVIAHHIDPRAALARYDGTRLKDEALRAQVVSDPAVREELAAGIAPELASVPKLSEAQISDLIVFLNHCGDPRVTQLEGLVPTSVPGGLPVDRHVE